MTKIVRKHRFAALLCLFVGLLILMFYRITRHGVLYIDWNTIWKAIAIGITLFAGLEVMRVISKKMILPHIRDQQYIKAYAVVLVLCFLCSLVSVLVYNRLRYGMLIPGVQTLGKVGILCLGLFGLFCIEVWLVRKALRTETKGFSFNCSELTISILCLVSVAFSFIPVMSDYVNQKYPLAYGISTIVSRGGVTADYGIVGEITKDRIISQTFVCTSNGLYSIELQGATYGQTNVGTLTISLVDTETEETVEQWNLDASKFVDNSYFTINIEQPLARLDMKGKKYRIDIYSADAFPGNALTLYYRKTNYYQDGDFLIDGEQIDGDLEMTIRGINGPANYERVRIILCALYAVAAEAAILLFFRRRYRRYVERRDGDVGDV